PDGVLAGGAGPGGGLPAPGAGHGVAAHPRILGHPAGPAAGGRPVHRPRAGRRRGAGGLMPLSPAEVRWPCSPRQEPARLRSAVPTPAAQLTHDEVVALYRRHIGTGRAALGAMLGAIVEVR